MRRFAAKPLAALLALLALGTTGALAYWTVSGTGQASASVGTLSAPAIGTLTPGSGTVSLDWSTVTPPGSGAASYYVLRDGGPAAAACGTAAAPIAATSCVDSGVAPGAHSYEVVAVWRTWTARSAPKTTTVTAATLDHFTITPSSGSQTAGAPFSVTVTAKDASGNTVTGYRGTVHFTSSDSAAALPADYAFTAGDNGSHVFTGVTLKTAGAGRTLTVADGGKTGTATYTVAPGAPSKLAFTTQPGNGTGGSPLSPQPVVTVQDAFGNTATSDSSLVGLTLTPGSGSAGAVFTCAPVNAVAGVATFSGCAVDKAGTGYRLDATATGIASATSAAFDVTVGAAAKLVFTTQPGNGTAVSALSPQPVVQVQDAGGNRVTSSNAQVNLALSGGTAGANLTCAPVNASAGVATFSGCGVDKIGTGYTLVASSGTLASATSAPFNVTAGPATAFVIGGLPATMTAGTAEASVTLTALDAAGNTATGYTGQHTITWTAPASPKPAQPIFPPNPLTFTAGVSSPFSVTLVKAGANAVTAKEGTSGPSGSASPYVQSAGVQLAYDKTCPVNVAKGSTTTFNVIVPNDAFGNPFTRQSPIGITLTLGGSDGGSNVIFDPAGGGTLQLSIASSPTPFNVKVNGANKSASLTMSGVPTGFTAAPSCAIQGGN